MSRVWGKEKKKKQQTIKRASTEAVLSFSLWRTRLAFELLIVHPGGDSERYRRDAAQEGGSRGVEQQWQADGNSVCHRRRRRRRRLGQPALLSRLFPYLRRLFLEVFLEPLLTARARDISEVDERATTAATVEEEAEAARGAALRRRPARNADDADADTDSNAAAPPGLLVVFAVGITPQPPLERTNTA